MQIFNKFTTSDGKMLVQSVHLDRENVCFVIAESDGETRGEIFIDPAGAAALKEAIDREIEEADNERTN